MVSFFPSCFWATSIFVIIYSAPSNPAARAVSAHHLLFCIKVLYFSVLPHSICFLSLKILLPEKERQPPLPAYHGQFPSLPSPITCNFLSAFMFLQCQKIPLLSTMTMMMPQSTPVFALHLCFSTQKKTILFNFLYFTRTE